MPPQTAGTGWLEGKIGTDKLAEDKTTQIASIFPPQGHQGSLELSHEKLRCHHR